MPVLSQISAISITEAMFPLGERGRVREAGRDIWLAEISIITVMGGQSL